MDNNIYMCVCVCREREMEGGREGGREGDRSFCSFSFSSLLCLDYSVTFAFLNKKIMKK